jgi:phosphonate transport system permease protein
MSQSTTIRRWKRPPFIQNPTLRWGLWVGAAIYLALAFGTMEIDWTRVAEGATRGERFIMQSRTVSSKACG